MSSRSAPAFIAGVAGAPRFLPALAAALAGVLQWLSVRGQPLDPDAQTFLELAGTADPLTAASMFREPLWPVLLAVPTALFGQQSDVARLGGVAAFVVMIVAFQLLAGQLFGRLWAGVGALLLAISPWLVYQSARGLREELAAGLIILFTLATLPTRWTVRRSAMIGSLLGLTALLRWDSLLITLPVVCVGAATRRLGFRGLVLTLAVAAVLVAPLLAGNYIKNGDPFYFSNRHAGFFRNLESRDRLGSPVLGEIADVSGGPRITWGEYLFGLHTPQEILKSSAWGAAAVPYGTVSLSLFRAFGPPVSPDQATASPQNFLKVLSAALLVCAGMAGAVLLLFGSNWPVGLVLFLAVGQFAPIAALFDPRLALTVVPFTALGVMAMLTTIDRRVRPRLTAARKRHGVFRVP